jgi:hypothetical protein
MQGRVAYFRGRRPGRSESVDVTSRTARRAGMLSILQYRMGSAMGLRDLLTRSSGWRWCGHDRKVSMWSMSSRGRAISVVRLLVVMVVAAIGVCDMIRGGGVGRLGIIRERHRDRSLKMAFAVSETEP